MALRTTLVHATDDDDELLCTMSRSVDTVMYKTDKLRVKYDMLVLPVFYVRPVSLLSLPVCV